MPWSKVRLFCCSGPQTGPQVFDPVQHLRVKVGFEPKLAVEVKKPVESRQKGQHHTQFAANQAFAERQKLPGNAVNTLVHPGKKRVKQQDHYPHAQQRKGQRIKLTPVIAQVIVQVSGQEVNREDRQNKDKGFEQMSEKHGVGCQWRSAVKVDGNAAGTEQPLSPGNRLTSDPAYSIS